jgi:hypothetical protein
LESSLENKGGRKGAGREIKTFRAFIIMMGVFDG